MSAIPITQIYDYLASAFGKETAEKLIIYLEQKMISIMENKSQLLATKEDLQKEVSRLDLKINETKSELREDIANLKVEFHKEFNKINEQIASLVKWIVGFGITIVILFVSISLRR